MKDDPAAVEAQADEIKTRYPKIFRCDDDVCGEPRDVPSCPRLAAGEVANVCVRSGSP